MSGSSYITFCFKCSKKKALVVSEDLKYGELSMECLNCGLSREQVEGQLDEEDLENLREYHNWEKE